MLVGCYYLKEWKKQLTGNTKTISNDMMGKAWGKAGVKQMTEE